MGSAGDDIIVGSVDSNSIDGGTGIDSLNGGDGMDTLIGTRLNADTLDGGAGFDLVTYQTETGFGLAINLATSMMTQSTNTESILGFEAVIGGEKNDTITGGTAAENLNGFKGNDTIAAGRGVDTLQGGEGKDTLTGGANNDFFVYTARSHSVGTNKDTITDFVHAADVIDLSGLGFTGIQAGAASGTILGYTASGGITTLQSATADFAIALTGNITLTSVDFDFV
jgi:serralysin